MQSTSNSDVNPFSKQGVLRVRVIEAKQLMKMDVGVLGMGKSDPYAIVTVGSQEFRTKTISNTINPKWDFHCEVSKHAIDQWVT